SPHCEFVAACAFWPQRWVEAQDGPLGGRSETEGKIRAALEAGGIEFIDENGGGPGVRLRKRQRKGG
ncbi:MAG: hypothetical protein WBD95_28500, partial [Xanthobacteraceae bacterium]